MIFSWKKKHALPPSAAGLVGKIPCQPDFVREGASDASADALDAWLVQAVPHLQLAGGVARMPQLSFCRCLVEQSRALIGVCAPSRDAAGREFPVAIFRTVELASLRPHLGRLFWQFEPFLRAASDLVEQLPRMSDLAELRVALAELPSAPPSAADTPGPDLRSMQSQTFLESVFGADPAYEQLYGLYAFAAAFAAGADANPTLDCPVRSERDARVWLELATQLSARTGGAPSLLYAPEHGRLLVSASHWASELLRALAEPGYTCDRIWPLTTQAAPALDQARSDMLSVMPELASTRGLPVLELANRLANFSASLLD
jgi:type VI secretion system protein ImpM